MSARRLTSLLHFPSEVQLFLEPHVPSKEPIYLNIKFGEGASGVEYENLEFRWKRMGTKEIELETADASLPVKIALALRLGDSPSGKFLFEEKFVGKDVRAVQKFVEAVTLLRQTGRVEIADAVRDRVLFSAVMNTDSLSELNRRFKKVLDEICEIAERFRLRLRMPPAIDKETLESIPILLQLARNGRSQVELSNVTATLSKVTDEERFMAGLQSENAFTFAFEDFVAPARIFGKEIHVGPASIVCSRAIIRNSDEAKQRYLAAKEGGGIPLDFEPLSPSEIVLGRIAHTE